jgi:2-oxoisovalerate dehydrogenase E2 component (dihydrolipoyl transacylase)
MDSPHGLAVPNIKAVNSLSMLEVQAELNRLRDLAKEGRLGAGDISGGTISLSNIGIIGGTYLGPLILPPQVCIVGIGRTILQPVWLDGEFRPRQTMNVSFGCDHRVLDGATVAKFSNHWKGLLENP